MLLGCLLAVPSARAADESAGPPPTPIPSPSPAPGTAPGWTTTRSHVVVAAYNPLGFDTWTFLGLRHSFLAHDSLLFRDNFITVGLAPKINPAYLHVGPFLEFQPIAFFHLDAGAEYMQFFDTFGDLQSYPSPLANYSDADRARTAPRAYAASAFHLLLQPTLQARAGPIAVRNRLLAEYWNAALRRGDTVLYAPALDTLAPNGGWTLYDFTDLLYLGIPDWVLGARVTDVQPLYTRRDYAAGETGSAHNGYEQAGALAAWTLPHAQTRALGRPTLFLFSGWYLQHRYRTATPADRATPNIVGGVAFEVP